MRKLCTLFFSCYILVIPAVAQNVAVTLIRTFDNLEGRPYVVAYSPTGDQFLTRSGAWTARLWDISTGEQVHLLEGHTGVILDAAFSPDGAKILTGSDDKTARIWNAQSGEEIVTLHAGDRESIFTVAFSPDGSQIITGGGRLGIGRVVGVTKIWDAYTSAEIRTLEEHTNIVRSVAFSPDGTRILTGSWDGTARIWDAETGETIQILAGHTGDVASVAYSPDGTRVLTASRGWIPAARLWDAHTGELLDSFRGHGSGVDFVSFSPDGTYILTIGHQWGDECYVFTAKLWNASNGALLHTFEENDDGPLLDAAFSPDGAKLLIGSSSGTLRLWDISNVETAVGEWRIYGNRQ